MAFEAFSTAIKQKTSNRFNKTTSDKGAVCLESTLNLNVDAYAGIKPGTPREEIERHIDTALRSHLRNGDFNAIVDLATIIFQKRSIKEGETRRDEARWAFLRFYQHLPNEAISLLPLFTEKGYGYWHDLNQIWRAVCDELTQESTGKVTDAELTRFYTHYNPLITEIIHLFVTQRTQDLQYLATDNHAQISMCAKWILSENSACNKPRKADIRSAKRTAAAIARIAEERAGGTFTTRSYKMKTKDRDTPIFWFYYNKRGEMVRQTYVNMMIRYILNTEIGSPWTRKDIPFRAKKEYRKGNSRLRTALKILEQRLCSKNPAAIDPSKLTGKNLTRYSKYLYNELTTPPGREPIKLKSHEQITGNREPNDPAHISLRKRTKDFFKSPKSVEMLKGKTGTLTPLELYITAKNPRTSEAEMDQNETLWKAMTADTRDKIAVYCVENGVRRRKIIPMVDMSASMRQQLPGVTQPTHTDLRSGLCPQKSVADAAMSLGIMAATTAPEDDPLYGTMLSFSSQPTWFNLPQGTSLRSMIQSVDTNTRGDRLNTNFYKAYLEVIYTLAGLVATGKMSADEVTDVTLVALSDLQFDSQSCPGYDSNWNTTYQRLEKEAVHLGLPGLPTMIFWNLATRPKSIQAGSSKQGVEFLSGYSQNNIRHAFYGPSEDDITTDVMVDGVVVKVANTTPLDKMMRILYQPFFDKVRQVFTTMNTGPFASYRFERPEEEPEDNDTEDGDVADVGVAEVSGW